ncbi:MAG: hypothetical protein WHT47_02255 [Hydrogenothermaceae bacterium]
MKFKLTRFYPQKIEIEILLNQLISMFPIEMQEHPTFGLIKRVWRTTDKEFSIESFPQDMIENLSSSKTYLKVKDEAMKSILQNLDSFEIVLYYEDKEDIYRVMKSD